MSAKLHPSLALWLLTACTISIGWHSHVLADEPIPLVVATVCMNAATDTQANLQTYFSYMEQASAQGAHLILFPEASLQQNPGWHAQNTSGPTADEIAYLHETAEPIPGASTTALVQRAKELNLYVVFGMTEKTEGEDELYNTSVLLGPAGVLGTHRKNPLAGADVGYSEDQCWMPGNDNGIVTTPMGTAGLLTCIELYFGEGQIRDKAGAEFLAMVAGWDAVGRSLYHQLLGRSARITELWHFVSNQTGSVGDYQFSGHSMIVDPEGNVIADTGDREGMVVAPTGIMIDLQEMGFTDSPTAAEETGWAKLKSLMGKWSW